MFTSAHSLHNLRHLEADARFGEDVGGVVPVVVQPASFGWLRAVCINAHVASYGGPILTVGRTIFEMRLGL